MYASVYFDIDEEVKGLIINSFDKETEAVMSKEMPNIKIGKYKGSLMRSYLICCFENFQFTAFPVSK